MSTDREALKAIQDITNKILNSPSQNDSMYDENGVSEPSEHGGVRIASVDRLIQSLKNDPDKLWQQVANEQDEYYCFLSPFIEHTPKQVKFISAHQRKLFASSVYGAGHIRDYKELRGLYENTETGEEIYRPPNTKEYYSGKWKKIRNRTLNAIDNHAVVANGNYSDIDHPDWKAELFDKIYDFVKARMQAHYDRLNSADTRQ